MSPGLPDLESAIAALDLSTHQEVDWSRIQRSVYLIHQHLRYDYPGPIQDLQQHLMILPALQHGDQHLIDHRLNVTHPSVEITYQIDIFGNTKIILCVPQIERTIDFEAWILIERQAGVGPHLLTIQDLANEKYTQPSRLTQPDAALEKIALRYQTEGRQGRELATTLNTWVYQTMKYTHEVTDIFTTAAEALALQQGVCQDYAHILVTLCRLCGLPARYVSGHMLGEGGTHAWVEVLLPDNTASERVAVVPLDPTHGRAAGINYVTVAVGRDYLDVAPMSGTYRAAYTGQLSTRKRMDLALYEYESLTQDAE